MDERYQILKMHPAIDPFGQTGNYGLRWEELQREIFHPLIAEYYNPLKIKNFLKHGIDWTIGYR